MAEKDNTYQAFQDFQKSFFTSPEKFCRYTQFEVKKHGFVLLNNIGKGFPSLSDKILNMQQFRAKKLALINNLKIRNI
jgi:hypothetical protein